MFFTFKLQIKFFILRALGNKKKGVDATRVSQKI